MQPSCLRSFATTSERPLSPLPLPECSSSKHGLRPWGDPSYTVSDFNFDSRLAIAQDRDQRTDIRIYTDGSVSANGAAGAAAVLLRAGCEPRVIRVFFPADMRLTSCDAEAAGLVLGLYLLTGEQRNSVACALSTDCQAVVLALQTHTAPGGRSGAYAPRLLAEFDRLADVLAGTHPTRAYSLQVRWVKGHSAEVEGNCIADREAGNAARGLGSPCRALPPIFRKESLFWDIKAPRWPCSLLERIDMEGRV